MADREELIRDLYKNIVGEKTVNLNAEKPRYHADTNTLTNSKVLNMEETNHRHEIMLEAPDYAEIMMGNKNYYLAKDVGYLVGDVIAFRELNNLQLTGNASLRTVVSVEKDVAGLVAGYCIIGWKM